MTQHKPPSNESQTISSMDKPSGKHRIEKTGGKRDRFGPTRAESLARILLEGRHVRSMKRP